jgi:hypothetical protein
MHNDFAYMVAMSEFKQKQAERERRALLLTELHKVQRKPGLIRRSLLALASWIRVSGRRSAAQPVDSGSPTTMSDAAERAVLRRTPHEQFRLHEV